MPSLEKTKFKMDLYRDVAVKIKERECSKSSAIEQCKGAVAALSAIDQYINDYKTKELSNDNLDKLKITTEKHQSIINHLNPTHNQIKDLMARNRQLADIYNGEQRGLNIAIDLIDKLNDIESAKKERAIRDLEEEEEEKKKSTKKTKPKKSK